MGDQFSFPNTSTATTDEAHIPFFYAQITLGILFSSLNIKP